MLRFSLAISRKETGWLRQNRQLFGDISPVAGLITAGDIDQALFDWDLACDNLHRHITARVKEVQRVARVHRDPFEPILPILEAASPVNEYCKITEEILTRMPDPRRYPVAAAEAVRGFLMLRLGLHTGLRQKNLRQLLICQRGVAPTSERRLTDLKRGELRWSERDDAWEILIPAAAFKNSQSSYFANKPFRLLLPDLGQLYHYIDAYLTQHRSVLLRAAQDPAPSSSRR